MTPKRVLVVDDDQDIRNSICDALAIAGHDSVGAADGRAALELLRARHFDLIVTDLQMPGMDGWQLLSALEANGVLRSIPVCVVSAEAQAPVRATRFLRKPFDLVSLVEIVTEVFERPRCHRCPSETGTLRVPSSVQKAWRRALKAAGIKRGFTVHGLRRTFNDLARRAGVDAVVTRAMTGHVTERMREHYSTVVLDEKRSAMTNVLQLVCGGVADEASGGAAEAEQGGGAGGCGDRPHAGAHGGADEAQIQQRPVGLGGANRA